MIRFRPLPLLLALLSLTVAACSGAREAAPPPVVGVWSWSLDTTDGVYTGTLTIAGMSAEDLTGTFLSITEGNRSYPMQDIAFDGSNLSFTVPHPSFGTLTGEAVLGEDDTLTGTLTVPGEGGFELTAERAAGDM